MTDEKRPEGTDPQAGEMVVEEQAATAVAEPAEEGQAEEKQKLTQTVDVSDAGPCKKHVKVTVAEEDIKRLINDKFSQMVGETQMRR